MVLDTLLVGIFGFACYSMGYRAHTFKIRQPEV